MRSMQLLISAALVTGTLGLSVRSLSGMSHLGARRL